LEGFLEWRTIQINLVILPRYLLAVSGLRLKELQERVLDLSRRNWMSKISMLPRFGYLISQEPHKYLVAQHSAPLSKP
jgi:hypothetical protein